MLCACRREAASSASLFLLPPLCSRLLGHCSALTSASLPPPLAQAGVAFSVVRSGAGWGQGGMSPSLGSPGTWSWASFPTGAGCGAEVGRGSPEAGSGWARDQGTGQDSCSLGRVPVGVVGPGRARRGRPMTGTGGSPGIRATLRTPSYYTGGSRGLIDPTCPCPQGLRGGEAEPSQGRGSGDRTGLTRADAADQEGCRSVRRCAQKPPLSCHLRRGDRRS